VAAVLVTSVGLGLSTQSVKICVDSLVQEWTADDVRGRAFSLYDMLFNLALVTSAVVAALVLPADGVAPAAFVGIAVLMLATAGLYGRATVGRPTSSCRGPSELPDQLWSAPSCRSAHQASSASLACFSSIGPWSIRSSSRWR
jgi:hypothetical protein